MPRPLFSRGSRGWLIGRIQGSLRNSGHYTGALDRLYGGATERAVSHYQTDNHLELTGKVDDLTWQSLLGENIPGLQDRCLQLTSAFEGHGFTLIQGNWDRAWLTWGIIGFTLRHGELSRIVLEVFAQAPGLLRAAFGEQSDELIRRMRASPAEQEHWANSISVGPKKYIVAEPWRSAFARFGEQPLVQEVQLRHANENYFLPAMRTASQYQLRSELGVALCFDIHVQNGGIKPEAQAAISDAKALEHPSDERALRLIIANAVADKAAQAKEDVRSRKLTLATGEGQVHGEQFRVESWGLGEFLSGIA